MKFLLSSIFLLALLGTTYGYSATWGKRSNLDYLLSRQVEVRYPIKNNYWSVNIDFPRAGAVNYYNISTVIVYDNIKNSSGATPSLWSGGPGYRFATVNLRSLVSKGINSTVEIWGH